MTLTFSVSSNSLAIQNILKANQDALQKSMQRLATGLRVNSAADGAADMAISSNMDSQLRGYDVATSNMQAGLSMLGTADGALQSLMSHLQNIHDIAVGASNSTTDTSGFSDYTDQLTAELAAITNITSNTKYGTNVLLDGTVAGGSAFNIQIGPNSGDTLDIKTAFSDNKTTTLTITKTSLASTTDAGTLLGQVNAAIDTVNSNLAVIGGFESRLTDQMSNVAIAKTNLASAQSSIRDTDVAQETATMTRLQILQQAGAYALAQANTSSQLALSLLPK